jgi:hypothetical protein
MVLGGVLGGVGERPTSYGKVLRARKDAVARFSAHSVGTIRFNRLDGSEELTKPIWDCPWLNQSSIPGLHGFRCSSLVRGRRRDLRRPNDSF